MHGAKFDRVPKKLWSLIYHTKPYTFGLGCHDDKTKASKGDVFSSVSVRVSLGDWLFSNKCQGSPYSRYNRFNEVWSLKYFPDFTFHPHDRLGAPISSIAAVMAALVLALKLHIFNLPKMRKSKSNKILVFVLLLLFF